MKPKYPDIEVNLTGMNGNAFVIMGAVSNALRRAKVPEVNIKEFIDECKGGDYDHLLQTCFKWVNVS